MVDASLYKWELVGSVQGRGGCTSQSDQNVPLAHGMSKTRVQLGA